MSKKFIIFAFLQLLVLILTSKSIETNENNRFLMSARCNDRYKDCSDYSIKGFCRNNTFIMGKLIFYLFSLILITENCHKTCFNCDIPKCPNNCSGNGECNNLTGNCKCKRGVILYFSLNI